MDKTRPTIKCHSGIIGRGQYTTLIVTQRPAYSAVLGKRTERMETIRRDLDKRG